MSLYHPYSCSDVYYFFTNDRSQGDEEEEEVAAKFGAGTGSRAADDAASLVKTKLPPLDALGLHALLNSLGFKISLKKADKSVKLANSRMPHKTTIEYEQVRRHALILRCNRGLVSANVKLLVHEELPPHHS